MKQTVLAVILFFAVLTATAQSSDKFTGSLLWKISGKGMKQPSYILGTHHLTAISFIDNISGLKGVIDNTEQTVGELLMSDKASMQSQIENNAIFTQGETYSDLLSPDEYAKLDEEFKALLGVGLDQLGIMKPGMLSMIYSITLYAKTNPDFNMGSHIAMDEYLQNIAIEKGKTVLGLETVDDQMRALFDSEPVKDQAKTLACSAANNDFTLRSIELLGKYYEEGNLSKLYDLAFNNPEDPCPYSEKSKRALVCERNNEWLKKLPGIMKNKSSLIAVGTLHLAGEEGLLFQLDKLGYKVEAVKQ